MEHICKRCFLLESGRDDTLKSIKEHIDRLSEKEKAKQLKEQHRTLAGFDDIEILKENKDLLDKMLSMDEGAPYLGELALIPQDSPIANTGILFYNTLFDENASCHVALGRGFCDTVDGFEEKTLEECQAMGVNDSMIHVDFMIGAPDLEITGYKDGKDVFYNYCEDYEDKRND